MRKPEIVVPGKDNGDGMIIRYQTAKKTDVFGLAIPNIYSGADWDLGPTWCYLIIGQKNILIDTGRIGNLDFLEHLLKRIDKQLTDLNIIVMTHCHEDHDGNLAEIVEAVRPEIWAHPIYSQMISYHPDVEDGAVNPNLPGSCRHCFMPESFRQDCYPYHRKRSLLKVDFAIDDEVVPPVDDIRFVFTPGHTPDSICAILEEEVIFTGDTILPEITPHPSRVCMFNFNRRILPEQYRQKNGVYGLMNYIRSLDKIASMPQSLAAFPAHRLFFGGQFNLISKTSDRAREIIQAHIDRCRDILDILGHKPLGMDAIAREYFPASKLEGAGKLMARNEIIAHVEVMEQCGDICWAGENGDLVQSTGTTGCLDAIEVHL